MGVEFIPRNVFSRIEKDDDLVKTIEVSKVGYAKPFRFTWYAHNWNSKLPSPIERRKCKPCTSTMNKK